MIRDDEDDHYESDDPDDDDMDEESCGSTGDGQCTLAGTEWCDWSCPLHNQVFAKTIQRVKRKVKK